MTTRRRAAGGIDWQQVRAPGAGPHSPRRVAAPVAGAHPCRDGRAGARLAQVPPVAPAAAEVLEVVTFTLANERYALETCHTREVVRFSDLTPVPSAPEFLAGLINLRGEIVAVFDLRRFFGLAEQTPSDLLRAIVLGAERGEFGVLADSVGEVMTLRIDEVREAPGSVAGAAREYLRGVTAAALLVLDGAVLLRDGRLCIDQTDEIGVLIQEEKP